MATNSNEEKHNHILNGDYLESHQIYDLFRHLLSQTLIHKPEDHLAFLIKELSHSPPQNVFFFVFWLLSLFMMKYRNFQLKKHKKPKKHIAKMWQNGEK